jgi:hypothetical protein
MMFFAVITQRIGDWVRGMRFCRRRESDNLIFRICSKYFYFFYGNFIIRDRTGFIKSKGFRVGDSLDIFAALNQYARF